MRICVFIDDFSVGANGKHEFTDWAFGWQRGIDKSKIEEITFTTAHAIRIIHEVFYELTFIPNFSYHYVAIKANAI